MTTTLAASLPTLGETPTRTWRLLFGAARRGTDKVEVQEPDTRAGVVLSSSLFHPPRYPCGQASNPMSVELHFNHRPRAAARGTTLFDAAEQLGISANTVAHHVKNIYPKLAVGSRGEAVYRAVQDGLISLDR